MFLLQLAGHQDLHIQKDSIFKVIMFLSVHVKRRAMMKSNKAIQNTMYSNLVRAGCQPGLLSSHVDIINCQVSQLSLPLMRVLGVEIHASG